MILQWTETDQYGEITVRENSAFSLEQARDKAKKNHVSCNGTGLEKWDNGYKYVYEYDEELQRNILVRKVVNPRVYACDCVLRRLQRNK